MTPLFRLIRSAALLLLAVSSLWAASPRRNVLFIAVDDMNNDLRTYGHPYVSSPNIDRLARMGVRFDRAYCQFPLCSPSRTSLMTGLRPDAAKVFDLQTHFRDLQPNIVTLPQMFMRQGYYAARVGKIYHYGNPGDIGTPGLDDAPSWNHTVNPAGRDKTTLESDIINYTPQRGLGSAMSFLSDKKGTDEEHTDGKVATETIKLLEQKRDQPFFIACGFYKPHTPYVAPAKYFDLYPIEKIKVAVGPESHLKDIPKAALSSTNPWPWFGVNEQQAREVKQGYYAAISFVDAQIGRVLAAVDRLKLWDNTIVVFWSDHGYHLGEHGLWMKQSLFENSARVPMIIVAPGAGGNGRPSARTVEFVDLYPTLADLCGLTPPAHLAGKSLKPLLENPQATWDKPAFTQVWRGTFAGHSVRTERYRYTEWDDGKQGAQLYDYETDPQEHRNLAQDPAHATIVAEMKRLLVANWANEYKPAPGAGKKGGRKKS